MLDSIALRVLLLSSSAILELIQLLKVTLNHQTAKLALQESTALLRVRLLLLEIVEQVSTVRKVLPSKTLASSRATLAITAQLALTNRSFVLMENTLML